MDSAQRTAERLRGVAGLSVLEHEPLARHTRFAIGGPARIFTETADEAAFAEAVRVARESELPLTVIGGGTNLIVSGAGFPGIVLVFGGSAISSDGTRVRVAAGAVLQDLVDFAISKSLKGLETLAGIPGWVGAAVYGNAGAYGHSISERVASVRFFDGARVRTFHNAECEFHYRESRFKQNKDWIVFSADLELTPGDGAALRKVADDILAVRNAKFPPTMKCAGSIFKNFLLRDLPEPVKAQTPAHAIREGKVPAAYFLEQVGAKGFRVGGIEVAEYHANLIYNTGSAEAHQLVQVIESLKWRVRERFGIEIEEEVQYLGFTEAGGPAVERLAAAPRALRLLAGTANAEAAEIVARLAAREVVYIGPGIAGILNGDGLPLAEYTYEADEPRPLAEWLAIFERARARNVAILRSLAPVSITYPLREMLCESAANDLMLTARLCESLERTGTIGTADGNGCEPRWCKLAF